MGFFMIPGVVPFLISLNATYDETAKWGAYLLLSAITPFAVVYLHMLAVPKHTNRRSGGVITVYWLYLMTRCAVVLSAGKFVLTAVDGDEHRPLQFFLLDFYRGVGSIVITCVTILMLQLRYVSAWASLRNVMVLPPMLTMALTVSYSHMGLVYTPNNTPLPYLTLRQVCYYLSGALCHIYSYES
jgi:hypothetical protein